MNKVIISGNLTKAVEIKTTDEGLAIGHVSIAINSSYKKDEAYFFDVTFFGKTAETASTYLNKGSKILIEGSLVQQKWTKDGKNYSKVSIKCDRFEFLDKKISNDEANNENNVVENPDYSDAQEAEEEAPF